MNFNLAEPKSALELSENRENSILRLFELFKANRDCNLARLLLWRRLGRSHERLAGIPKATQTVILLECEVGNYNEILRACPEQFGETPARSGSQLP